MGKAMTVAARLMIDRPLPIGWSSKPANRKVKGRASPSSLRRPAKREALSKPVRAVKPDRAGIKVSETIKEVTRERQTVMAWSLSGCSPLWPWA